MTGRRVVGRDRELVRITATLDRASSEQPTVALISGDAGLGKTTLLREALDRASGRGFAVVVGAAAPGACGLAFAPVRAAFRAIPDLYPREGLDVLLQHRPGVAALLPTRPLHSSPDVVPGAASLERAELYVEVLELLGELAERQPLVMALEDLHWADYSTLEMLDFLARNLTGERVVLMGTVRSDEPDADEYATRTLAELARLPGVESIELAGLARPAFAQLMAGELGSAADEATVDELFRRVGGNPFYAIELVHAGAASAGLPKSVRDALRVRLAELSDRHRQLVRAAAVVGVEVQPELIAAFLDRPSDEVEEACRAARQAEVLVIDPADGELRFRHGLLREQAYSELMAGERRRLHDRLADHLAADPRTPPALLAYHYEGAGRFSEALVHTLHAARNAAGVHGSLDAVRHYRRVVELWSAIPNASDAVGRQLVEVLEEASVVALNVAVTEQAAPFLDALLRELDPTRQPERWAKTAALLSEARWEAGHPEDAFRLLDQAEELLTGRPPSPATVRLLERRSYQALDTGRLDDAARAADEALKAAAQVGDVELRAVALGRLGLAQVTLGHPEGLDQVRESLRLARTLGPSHEAARAAINLLAVLHAAGDMEVAERTARELLDAVDQIAIGPDDRALITALGVRIATARGQLDQAGDDLAMAVVPTTLRYREYLALADAEHAVATGDFPRASERVGSTATSDALLPSLHRSVVAAELALRTGRPSVARRIVDDRLDPAEFYPEVTHLRLCGLALEASERDDPTADAYLERAERKHDSLRRHPVIATDAVAGLIGTVRLLHALVRRQPPGDSGDAATRALDAAGLHLLGAWARYHHARCLVETGGDRTRAAQLVAEAHTWAATAGAVPLRSATEDLVRRARLDVAGVSRVADRDLGLTEREAEVLRLVAAGRTNREVAERLYISPKTASVHVSNILRKIGAANRGEAAAIAHRHGVLVTP